MELLNINSSKQPATDHSWHKASSGFMDPVRSVWSVSAGVCKVQLFYLPKWVQEE